MLFALTSTIQRKSISCARVQVYFFCCNQLHAYGNLNNSIGKTVM